MEVSRKKKKMRIESKHVKKKINESEKKIAREERRDKLQDREQLPMAIVSPSLSIINDIKKSRSIPRL